MGVQQDKFKYVSSPTDCAAPSSTSMRRWTIRLYKPLRMLDSPDAATLLVETGSGLVNAVGTGIAWVFVLVTLNNIEP